MISEYLSMLFYAGEIQIQIDEGWKWQRIYKRVRFARADKAGALQYHNQ